MQNGEFIMKKESILKFIFNWLYEPIYLLWFSIKDAGLSVIETLQELKKPRTWLAILVGTVFIVFITRKYALFKWILPLIIIVYIIRQKVDGKYKHTMRVNALMNDNNLVLEPYYEKYKKECRFIKKEPLSYEEWKKEELNKV